MHWFLLTKQVLEPLLYGHLQVALAEEKKQFRLSGSLPGTLSSTNHGMSGAIDQQLRVVGLEAMAENNAVIHS